MAIRLKDTLAGSISGNAATATKLAKAVTINGVAFDGSSNITISASSSGGNSSTATKLQTARTLTVGSTGKSFDGSANVSWTLAEIGAAASSHTHNYAGSSSAGGAATSALACTGNAATATTLQTARTINGTSFNGSANITTANWGTARTITIGNTGKSVNGSANVSWSLSEIGAAAASHTHNYASMTHTHTTLQYTDLSNQTVSLNNYNMSSGFEHVAYYYCPTDGGGTNITGRPNDSNKTAFNLKVELLRWASTTDYITKQTYTRGAEKVSYVRYCTNGTWSSWEKIYTSVNKPTVSEIGAAASSHTHNYAGSSSAGGAANSATILATARTINGTSFNGSANITTANWGTARTITIGSTGKSVNGSANVSWTLSEIGAAAASHTHSGYASSSHSHAWSAITSKPTISAGGGSSSILEGGAKTASGTYSHAEGYNSEAKGNYGSHAEGYGCVASGLSTHAEGAATKAVGSYSHAEGYGSTANGAYGSHAEGCYTTAGLDYSHAEGYYSTASGSVSHASGYYTTAQGYCQTAIGKFNVLQGTTTSNSTTDAAFIIGNGTGTSSRSNAFRVTWAGLVYSKGAYSTSGADYAEMFEWADGNPDNEERIGYFVTFEEGTEQVRKANSKDKYILGIVSHGMAILGDNYDEEWKDKYLRDKWGRIKYETIKTEDMLDLEGNLIREGYLTEAPIVNPEFDSRSTYVSRQNRKEWSAIGLLGKLLVYDDGTCEVGQFCMPNDEGIATKSESGFYVMARESENIIKVLFK